MIWPFKRKSAAAAAAAPKPDAIWPGIKAAQDKMLEAIELGNWEDAERWVERLEAMDDPRALFPGLAGYIRLEAWRGRRSVYEWFEPEKGRPR